MSSQPLHTLRVSYSREDYEKYFRFYKTALKKTPLKLVFYFAVSVVIGLLLGYYLNWMCLGIFVVIGAAMDAYIIWSQKQVDKRVYDHEKSAMPITYRFYPEKMEVETVSGDIQSIMYRDLYTVFEVDTAFYIMLDKNTVAIIPKRDCSEELTQLILSFGKIKEDWIYSQS